RCGARPPGGAACGLLALGPMSGRKMGRGYRRAVNFSLLGAGEPARVSAGHGLGLRLLFVERERKPLGAKAAGPCDMPAQLANESFRADYVRFGNSVSAVMQVLMRSDIPAAEAFFRDHLRVSRSEILAATLQFLPPFRAALYDGRGAL